MVKIQIWLSHAKKNTYSVILCLFYMMTNATDLHIHFPAVQWATDTSCKYPHGGAAASQFSLTTLSRGEESGKVQNNCVKAANCSHFKWVLREPRAKQLEIDFVFESHVHNSGVQIVSGPEGAIPLMFSRQVDPNIREDCVCLCVSVWAVCPWLPVNCAEHAKCLIEGQRE